MQHWRVDVGFTTTGPYATTDAADPEYETCDIRFNTKKMSRDGVVEEELDGIIIHELFHAMAWAAIDASPGEYKTKAEETLCQRVARIVLQLAC